MNLSLKQKLFADYYIETGNATESATKAGYSKKTARVIGSENLTKPNVREYIDARLKEIESKKIASAEEVMKYLTSVMRGEIKDAFDMDPSIQDRNKAAEALMKRYDATKIKQKDELDIEEQKLRIEKMRIENQVRSGHGNDSEMEKVDRLLEGIKEQANNIRNEK